MQVQASAEVVLEAKGLSKTYDGSRYVLDNASFAISRGQKVAVVGPNGGGKSSLLRILAQEDTMLDAGDVVWPHGVRTSLLHQHSLERFDGTVRDAVFSGDRELADVVAEYRAAIAASDASHGGGNEKNSNRLARALERMDSLNAWSAEADAKAMLATLGCGGLEDARVERLSGGQRKRVAIVSALMKRADVLLLDEPTNSISVDGVEWIEEFIQQRPHLTMLLVSHDRALLNNVCDTVLEVEGDGPVNVYYGNYMSFLQQREERLLEEQRQVDRARQMLKKESEWASKQPRARGTKNRARMEKYEELKGEAQARELFTSAFDIEHLPSHRLGKQVVEVNNGCVSFVNTHGDDASSTTILQDFNFSLGHQDRVGIVGKNGAGKSTFLKVLTGDVTLDDGSVTIGDTVVFGHFEQEPTLPEQQRAHVILSFNIQDFATCALHTLNGTSVTEFVDDLVEATGGTPAGQETRSLLRRFNFRGDRQHTRIDSLSGGERQRLALLRLYLQQPNVLLNDEPTTSLDTDSIEAYERLLQSFDGSVVTVSHDRAFLDKVANRLLVFEGDGHIYEWVGTYSEFREKLKAENKKKGQSARMEETSSPKASADARGVTEAKHETAYEDPVRRKKRINAPRNIKRVEAQLSELEQEIALVYRQLNEAGADVERAQELSQQLDGLKQREEKLFEEWEELDQLVQEYEAMKR